MMDLTQPSNLELSYSRTQFSKFKSNSKESNDDASPLSFPNNTIDSFNMADTNFSKKNTLPMNYSVSKIDL